jgi:hypothetical protein
MHQLRAEGHVQVDQLRLARLRSETGYRDEAVEIPRPAARGIEVDRVTSAEQAGHHGLRDAGCQAGSDSRVCGVPAFSEDLDARGRGRRMTRRYSRLHDTRR